MITKLYREAAYPQIRKAIVRKDGVHFIDLHDNKERINPSYPSLEALNENLRKLGFELFNIVKDWPKKEGKW